MKIHLIKIFMEIIFYEKATFKVIYAFKMLKILSVHK